MPERFIFDRTLRDLLKGLPRCFVKILAGVAPLEYLDVNFPKVEEREADLLVRLKNGEIFHLEVQAQADVFIPFRMLRYYCLIYQQYHIVPQQMVLWVGDGENPFVNKLERKNLFFRYELMDIKEIDCAELIASDDPNDNILAVLCRRSDGFWESLLEKLRCLPEKERDNYIRKLLYLVKLRKSALYELNSLRKEADMPIVIDVLKDPFYNEGIQQGIQKGLILDAQEMVLAALTEKFGQDAQRFTEKIKSIESRDILVRLLKNVIKAELLVEIEKELEEIN